MEGAARDEIERLNREIQYRLLQEQELPDGWISVAITPELVYAMALGDTDGLAVMDGGTISLHNNMMHSVQSGRFAPYIEADLGPVLAEVALDLGGEVVDVAHLQPVDTELGSTFSVLDVL